MTANTRHSLTQAATIAGCTVMDKSASASPEQTEVLAAVWPSNEETSKTAYLAKVLAAGALVEEAGG